MLLERDPSNKRLRTVLDGLFGDHDEDVRAHAALGLWRAGNPCDGALAKALVDAIGSPVTKMKLKPQPDLLRAVMKLLEDEDAFVRSRAAWVLGGWGGGWGAAEAVLAALGADDRAAMVEYLETPAEDRSRECPPELARKLAEVIRPRSDDSPADGARREVVFCWLWGAAQTT